MPIVEKQAILTKKNERKHEVRTDPDDPDMVMEVWVRDISFLDVQKAAQSMFQMDGTNITLDLEGYWSYALSNWVVRTNPELTTQELTNLNAFVGQQIAALLPKPDEMAEAMQGGFTKANS
ncbi:hypothetical protein [Phenylobacterium sp.]|uniref:hypothetical protein n=1 Tax=Phenylobacterium sp. TaxID=1871053 RepID=UPI0025CD6237|nr:hypothetical protein [Phenylobacterium sp.]